MNNLLILFKRWFESRSKKQTWTAVLTVVGFLCTVILFSRDSGTETSIDPLGSPPLFFAGAFVKLMIVLLLIVVSAVFARRWLQPGLKGKTMRQLVLRESVRLSPKQALHIVSVGNQHFLVGATDQSVTLISPVEIATETAPVELVNLQPSLDFGSLLQSFNTNLPGNLSK